MKIKAPKQKLIEDDAKIRMRDFLLQYTPMENATIADVRAISDQCASLVGRALGMLDDEDIIDYQTRMSVEE